MRAITLMELLISIVLMSLLMLSYYSIDSFSRHHTVDAQRRVRVENELSYALEHMTKNIIQATGNMNSPPLAAVANGFSVRVDRNTPVTLPDLADDTTITYTLGAGVTASTLTCSLNNEVLSTHIVPGAEYAVMPVNPDKGFYINFTNNQTVVEIALVGRYYPDQPVSGDNPQVTMKSSIYTRNSAVQ